MSREISKDDVFIKPGSEHLWDAVLVVRVADGKVHFSPYHGGYVSSGTLEVFLDRFEKLSADRINELAKVMTPGMFGFEEGKDYPGHASSLLWNGFFQPAFERETIEQMMSDGFFSPDEGHGNLAWFDDEGNFFLASTESGEAIPATVTAGVVKAIVENGNMDFTIEAEGETLQYYVEKSQARSTKTQDGEKKLYRIGNEWTWQKAEEPQSSLSM